MADVAGVPVDAEVATRIANSIGPAFEGFAAGRRHAAVRSGARELPCRANRKGFEMSAEPALLSLTEVAQAIAQKRFSSREVTKSCLDRIAQWQPRLNAFMAIEAGRGAGGRRCRRRGACQRQRPWRAARRAAGAQGHVLRRRQGRHLRLEDPARFRRDLDLDRAAAPEGCRHDSAGLAADGGVRLWADRPQSRIMARCIIPGASITSPADRRRDRARRSRHG